MFRIVSLNRLYPGLVCTGIPGAPEVVLSEPLFSLGSRHIAFAGMSKAKNNITEYAAIEDPTTALFG